MSNANIAFGTTLSWNAETIAELTSIGELNTSVDMKEVTSHQSSDSFREYLPTLLNGGEVTISGNFYPGDSDGQVAMNTDMLAKTKREVIITYPSAMATTWTFDAYVSGLKTGPADIDGVVEFEATLQVTGKPTLGITSAGNATGIVLTGNIGGAMDQFPAFAAGTYVYGAEGAGDATFTVTVTAAAADKIEVVHAGATQEVASATPSSALTLTADDHEDVTIKVYETGKVTIEYTYKVIDS